MNYLNHYTTPWWCAADYTRTSDVCALYTQSAVSLWTYPCVGTHRQCACVVSLWQHGGLQTMLSYTDPLIVIWMGSVSFILMYIFSWFLFCILNFSNCYRNVHLTFSHGYNLLKYITDKLWVFIRGRGSFIPGSPLLTLRERSLQLGLRYSKKFDSILPKFHLQSCLWNMIRGQKGVYLLWRVYLHTFPSTGMTRFIG